MQSRRQSMIETCTNTLTGMVGSLIITLIILHTVDDKTLASVLTVSLCTVWSIVRGYVVRRHFNAQKA